MKISIICIFLVCIEVIYVNACGKPCSDGSTSCCNRGACGCVETSGLIEGCDSSCTANDGLRCPTRCDTDSKACCVVRRTCGCTDLSEYITLGGSDGDCKRTCSVGIELIDDFIAEDNVEDAVLPLPATDNNGSLGAFWFSFGFILCAGLVVAYYKFKQFDSKWQSVPEIEEIHNQLF